MATPKPTPKPTPRPKPKSEPEQPTKEAVVYRTFQVDRYLPRTAAAAALVARLDNDGLLQYREDRGLWGISRWEIVTVKVPAKADSAAVIAAVNAATSSAVGDIRTTDRLARMRQGQGVTMAWELGKDATAARPWGPQRATVQKYLGRS